MFNQPKEKQPEKPEIDIKIENGQLTRAVKDEIESIEVIEG